MNTKILNMKRLAYLALIVMLSTSCVTRKSLTYFSTAGVDGKDSIAQQVKPQDQRVVMGDALVILVSTLDPEAVAPYNLPMVTYVSPQDEQLATTPHYQYYTVDINGDIDFPVLGKLHVVGMTKSELIQMLQERLAPQLRDPVITVRFLNAHVTVLGEVNAPRQVSFVNDHMTLLEALGSAGDLTQFGRRDNILITRENNGKLEFARINLNDEDLFNSPYFFLQQNDVIYVSPNGVRAMNAQNVSLYLSMVTTLASMATVVVSVVTAAKNK